MKSIACSRCASWAESPAETMKFLKGEHEVCPGCPNKTAIERVIRQYHTNCPKWWVVDGVVVVPVWIKEQLRHTFRRVG